MVSPRTNLVIASDRLVHRPDAPRDDIPPALLHPAVKLQRSCVSGLGIAKLAGLELLLV